MPNIHEKYVGPETHAGLVSNESLHWYEVINPHDHVTLKAGDMVRMLWCGFAGVGNLLLRSDYTLHEPIDVHDQYVHLRRLKSVSESTASADTSIF